MNSEDSIGIIELGNINIKCLIFKIENNNESKILSTFITSLCGNSQRRSCKFSKGFQSN